MTKKFGEFVALNEMKFRSITQRNMSFELVFKKIKDYMRMDPFANYRLMIGTDSQVHSQYTTFATGIVIMRERNGAWGCIRKVKFPREFKVLKEKITMETALTGEVAFLFTEEMKTELIDIVLPNVYSGASFKMEGHVDVGKGQGSLTRFLVSEMSDRIESMGLEPVIKPDSFVASAYANRYTK